MAAMAGDAGDAGSVLISAYRAQLAVASGRAENGFEGEK